MEEDVFEVGKFPSTPRWFITRFDDKQYGINTPGQHLAAVCVTLTDARLIVGNLNLVPELQVQIATDRELRVEKMRELMQPQDVGVLERLEKRVARIERLLDASE